MGAKGGKQTVTQELDPFTERMRGQVWGAAHDAANAKVPGVDPWTQQAGQSYQQAVGAGNLGLAALTGDQAAFQQFMNPYQSQMLDVMNSRWGDLSAQTTNALNDQATRAGAFGGSRHGIAQGTAMAELHKNMAGQMAALQYQGFGDAAQRAGAAANLGFGAAGQLAQLGDYNRQVAMAQDPAVRQYEYLKGALTGMPTGMTTTQPLNRNAGAGFAGGALQGAGVGAQFGPWGAAIGGGLGGLLGLLN